MGFFARLLGLDDQTNRGGVPGPGTGPAPDPDTQAIERYRYLVRTAPPETLEQAYAEGFAKLTPEQRERVRAELAQNAPEAERAAITGASGNDTQILARAATRAEIRQPGAMERVLGSGGGFGAAGFGTHLLTSFAMGFVGSMVAQSFLSALSGFGADGEALAQGEAGARAEAYADEGELDGGDFGGGDFEI